MSERQCTITDYLKIVPAGLEEYRALSRFHYRDSNIGPYAAIYAIKDTHPVRSSFAGVVGVIVYTMPAINIELRNIAMGSKDLIGLSRKNKLKFINKAFRNISRIIIDPRYRGLGLASRLVRETMPLLNVPFVESLTVMGRFHPFFEKAGMKAYYGAPFKRCIRLTEAFTRVGIDERMLIDPDAVQARIESLSGSEQDFIEQQIRSFLRPYGKRRNMQEGIERTAFVLSKLTVRPVYYLWKNEEFGQDDN